MIEDAAIAAAFGVDEADVTDEMRDLVDSALAWVSTETQRYFGEVEEKVQYFEGGGDKLWLDETPQGTESAENLTVEEWDSETQDWDDEVEAADYQVRLTRTPAGRSSLVYTGGGCWPSRSACRTCPVDHLKVTYDAGYAVGGLPADIQRLVLYKALLESRTSGEGAGNAGIKKEFIDGYSYELFGSSDGGVSGLTAEHQSTLSRWTHTVFA